MNFEKLLYIGISSVIILIFIVIGNLISPSTSVVEEVKKVYYVDHISDSHKKIIELFNNKYKGEIEVVPINLPFEKFSTNERKELLSRYLRSKSDRIDIFSVDQIWVPKFAKWGVGFNDLLSKSQKDDILGFASETCFNGDTLIAAPLYIDIAVLFYRDDLLQKLPGYLKWKEKIDNSITWDDLLNFQKQYKKKNFFLFQADAYEGLICIFTEMMKGKGISLYENKELQLETPQAVEVLTLLCNLVNKYHISPFDVSYFKENASYDSFIENNALFVRGWPGFKSEFQNSMKMKGEQFKILKSAPTPHFKGFEQGSVYGGWNLMISKNSTKIPESLKFIKFILSEECQKLMYEIGGYLPSNKNLYKDSLFVAKHPELKFYYSLLQKGIYRASLKHYTNLSETLSPYLNLAIKGELSPKEALHRASEKIKSLGDLEQ